MDNSSTSAEDSLQWVKPYYTRAGQYWGPTGVEPRLTARLTTLHRLFGAEPKRILELGAGTGEVAAIMADAGHSVTAVEFSPTRVPNIETLAAQERAGSLIALEADFYEVVLSGNFDVVCYWDGFGIGSDSDQRRLLLRIASDWLVPGGHALIDVFNPFRWAREAGKEWHLPRNHESHRYHQRRSFEFDPVQGCALDTWCPINDETGVCDASMAITQRLRCYTPVDFELLLEGTGLILERVEGGGLEVEIRGRGARSQGPVWDSWSYLAILSLK